MVNPATVGKTKRMPAKGSMSRHKVYNVFFPSKYKVDGEERTEFLRVGTAFPLKESDGMTIEFAIPLTIKERQRVVVMPKEPAESRGRR